VATAELTQHQLEMKLYSCLVVCEPFCLMQSQITVPIFAIVHLPSIITLSTAWFTPSGWMYIIM
jgi:hypothetical protein